MLYSVKKAWFSAIILKIFIVKKNIICEEIYSENLFVYLLNSTVQIRPRRAMGRSFWTFLTLTTDLDEIWNTLWNMEEI